ncbi:MAG: transcriptional regulator [Candidatus Bathyarchaeia archaeon]|jgi:uncharacterized membrane protein
MRLDDRDRKKALIRALLDDYSRSILESTMVVSKSVIDITREQKIPMTSAYRKVKELKEFGMLKVERIVLTEDGKKYEMLRSTIRSANVIFEKDSLVVDVASNVEADEKMVKRFFALREAR